MQRHKRELKVANDSSDENYNIKLSFISQQHTNKLIYPKNALLVYNSIDEMLAFTNECLLCGKNILQHCLFLALGSMEVVAQLRVASILFLAVVVPMRWLA